MYDVVTVAVLDPGDDLLEETAGVGLLELKQRTFLAISNQCCPYPLSLVTFPCLTM